MRSKTLSEISPKPLKSEVIADSKSSIHLYLAEFIGTFFMIFLGCGAIIQAQLDPAAFNADLIAIAFGGTVAAMIYATGHVSGAHFNPAVSIAFCITGKLKRQHLPGYILSQILAAFSASLLHSFLWPQQGHNFGITSTELTLLQAAIIEFLITFMLMFVIYSVATDEKAEGKFAGLAIGLTVTLLAWVFGPMTGASMNPARSIGPALMAGDFGFLWLYVIFPILGASSAALFYETRLKNKDNERNI